MSKQELYWVTLALLGVLLLISLYCVSKSKNQYNSFLDIYSNIEILIYNQKVLHINRVGLIFFGFKSVKEFNKVHKKGISNFFIEEDGCYNRHSEGKKWLESIYKTKQKKVKVKIKSPADKMEYYFHMLVSKKSPSEYLLSFNNITKLESDKDIIRKQADYDALTHVYNRVKFNEIFPQQIGRALSFNETFSLILFDIDHFKIINDTYGHNIGDRVLVELSGLVKDIIKELKLRNRTVLTRWGGEEFVILLKLSTAQESRKVAERLRQEIESYSFDTVKKVTCSFGVTEFRMSDTQIGIFQRVDDALYEAKDAGRNRVVIK